MPYTGPGLPLSGVGILYVLRFPRVSYDKSAYSRAMYKLEVLFF